jgi:hypothetical protein
MEGEKMPDVQALPTISVVHIETINGATYEVTSNYIGNISLLDLLKQMLKRDLERTEE